MKKIITILVLIFIIYKCNGNENGNFPKWSEANKLKSIKMKGNESYCRGIYYINSKRADLVNPRYDSKFVIIQLKAKECNFSNNKFGNVGVVFYKKANMLQQGKSLMQLEEYVRFFKDLYADEKNLNEKIYFGEDAKKYVYDSNNNILYVSQSLDMSRYFNKKWVEDELGWGYFE